MCRGFLFPKPAADRVLATVNQSKTQTLNYVIPQADDLSMRYGLGFVSSRTNPRSLLPFTYRIYSYNSIVREAMYRTRTCRYATVYAGVSR